MRLLPRRYAVRWARFAAMCLTVMAFTVPAFAQTDFIAKVAEDVSIELSRQYGTAEKLDAAVTKAFGVKLTPEKAAVARSNLRTLITNEALPMYMAKLLVPLYRPGIAPKEMSAAVHEGITYMQVKGLARLESARQAAFVRHIVSMTKALSPPLCKAMFLGELSAGVSASLERAYIATLPIGKFEEVSNLYRQASEAELAGYPDARSINAQQAKLAEQVYAAASRKRLSAQVPPEVERRVNEGVASAPPGDVCAFMTSTIEGMLDMAEPFRSWQLTRFALSLQ